LVLKKLVNCLGEKLTSTSGHQLGRYINPMNN
jgi:hypothetical protein